VRPLTMRKLKKLRLLTGQNYGFMVNAWADREIESLSAVKTPVARRSSIPETPALYTTDDGDQPANYTVGHSHQPHHTAGIAASVPDSFAGPDQPCFVCHVCKREFDSDISSCPFCAGGEP